MARQIHFNNHTPYPSCSSSTTLKAHKRVLSTSSTTTSQPPPKRLSPSPSPPPLYIVTEILTPRSSHFQTQPIRQEIFHGVFTSLAEANSVVSRIRLGYGVFPREALLRYRAEIVDGALSWGVPWGGESWDGVEVGVRRVEGRELEEEVGRMGMEGLSLVRERGLEREGEDCVMGG